MFDISLTSPNFEKRQFRTLPVYISYGVLPTDLVGTLFTVNTTVLRA
jgi:hypothetical protein